MNKDNIELLKTLTAIEYKKFLQNALGYMQFISINGDDGFKFLSKPLKKMNIEADKKRIYIAFVYNSDGSYINSYWFYKSDLNKYFYQGNFKYSCEEYFDKFIENDVLTLLFLSSKSNVYFNEIIFRKLEIKEKLKTIFKPAINSYKFKYNFILGAGINHPFQVASWDDLLNDVETETKKLIKCSTSDLYKIVNDLGGTKYFVPQILKERNETLYFDLIYKNLYKTLGFNLFASLTNRNITSESIYKIAEICSVQSVISEQTILTFNYDNIFEKVFDIYFNKNLNFRIASVFKNCKRTVGSNINVVHLHGFMPDSYKGQNLYKNSIVLSTFEYMDAYSSRGYSYKNLYKNLDKINIIVGNSVSDYEEQKVFRNHHNLYLSKYSFLLTTKSPCDWMDNYKISYFLKIGIIPLIFDNFDDLVSFLDNLKPGNLE